jgi:hypothetical protein
LARAGRVLDSDSNPTKTARVDLAGVFPARRIVGFSAKAICFFDVDEK